MLGIGFVQKVSPKGFGFIDYGEGRDIFFHATAVASAEVFDDLQVGDRVAFHIDNSGDRIKAVDVERVDMPD